MRCLLPVELTRHRHREAPQTPPAGITTGRLSSPSGLGFRGTGRAAAGQARCSPSQGSRRGRSPRRREVRTAPRQWRPPAHAPECGGESPKPPRRVLGERPYHSRTARTALAGRPPPSALIGPRLDRTPMPRGDHRSREREGVRAGYSIFIPVFFQSARKPARPESVSGCLVRLLIRLAGMVATSAPIIAACLT